MWSCPLFPTTRWVPPTQPTQVSPYMKLTVLHASSCSISRQIIRFPQTGHMSKRGYGVCRVPGGQTQAWLPPCESETVTDGSSLRGVCVKPCGRQELEVGPAVQPQFVILHIFLFFVLFWDVCLHSALFGKRKMKRNHRIPRAGLQMANLNWCRPIVRQSS